MKNLYFFLLLFVFSCGYSQMNIPIGVNLVCEGVNTTYDLTSYVGFGDHAADYTVGYFENENDAMANTNPIVNPQTYSLTMSQQIFVRAVNIVTNQIEYGTFSFIVQPLPTVNPGELTFCDPAANPVYNLNDAIAQIIVGNPQDYSVTFYDSMILANIVAPTFSPSSFPEQVLGVVVRNLESGCASLTSLTLNTCPNPCPNPTAISVPAASITAYSATVSWNSPMVQSNEIILFPAGSPHPTATTPGWLSTSPLPSNSYTLAGLTPGTCYDVYVRSRCSAESVSDWAGPRSFCTYGCVDAGMCFDNLTLIAFFDENNNGIRESGEPAFTKGSFVFERNHSGILNYGNSSYGAFIMTDTNPQNLYDLSYVINQEFASYYSTSSTYTDINIPTGGGSHTYYFPIRLLQNYSNLEINLIPSQNPRPGFTYHNLIRYKNTGTGIINSGTITFTKDNLVSISNISENGAANTANGFSLNFNNLLPGEERTIDVVMLVPTIPIVNLGQILTNTASIIPIVDDAFPANNNDSLTQLIVGSYDPNDKSEAHGGKIAIDNFSSDDDLTYTIQFENTGSASAQFIRVEDLLDSGLNPDSVVMLNASHAYNMRRMGNKLVWNFYNINLPTTASDPAQSHGFIQFKVKPTAGYTAGTTIPNAADIYFDFNPAIVTDTFQTEFVETLATASFDINGFYMYPNPARTLIHIGLKNTTENMADINVYDVIGKSVKAINNVQTTETNVDVSRLSKGIYFVEITTESHLKVTKKLIID